MGVGLCFVLIASCMIIGLNGENACIYKGKQYLPYTKVYSNYDEVKQWCNVGICKADGSIWRLVDLSCRQSTPGPTSKTTIPTRVTTKFVSTEHAKNTRKSCVHEGKRYPHGSEIFRGVENSKSKCYIQVCMNGKVIMRSRDCRRSTTPATTTTQPYIPTTAPGCIYEGKHYPLNSEIDRGYDASSNWCYGTNCDSIGQIEHWDNFRCYTTTSRPTTVEETTTAPPRTTTELFTTPPVVTTPFGCYENGKFYEPGSDISEGYDESTDWCYGTYCDASGYAVSWDAWNCKKKHLKTTEIPSTTPEVPTTEIPSTTPEVPTTEIPSTTSEVPTTPPITTTFPPTIPEAGCYHSGKFYAPGSEVSEGYDESSDWCYGVYCDHSGNLINWDTWNCKRKEMTTDELPTTLPPTTIPPTPFGCFSDGKFFPPGSNIYTGYDESIDWCYGTVCSSDGSIIQWDDWNCKGRKLTSSRPSAVPTTEPATEFLTTEPVPETTTTDSPPPTTTLATTLSNEGCWYDGVLYPKGRDVYNRFEKHSSSCYGLFCNNDSSLIYWEKQNCNFPAVTSLPSLPPVESETGGKTEDQSRCIYKGEVYFTNQFIVKKCDEATKKCSMLFCNRFGKIVPKLLTDITRKQEISKQNLNVQNTKERLTKKDQ